jgi:hypothetical protein
VVRIFCPIYAQETRSDIATLPSIIPFPREQHAAKSPLAEERSQRCLPIVVDNACVATNSDPHVSLSSFLNQSIDAQQTFIRIPENHPDSSSSSGSNGHYTPEIRKEVFSVPTSPATFSSVHLRQLQSSTFATATQDSMFHSSSKDYLHQVSFRFVLRPSIFL